MIEHYRIVLNLAVVLWSGSAFAQNGQKNADVFGTSMVKFCVNQVHEAAMQAPVYLTPFYTGFDAYYNPANGLVYNNARSVGDQKPLFVFQKCMAEHGLPLSSPAAN